MRSVIGMAMVAVVVAGDLQVAPTRPAWAGIEGTRTAEFLKLGAGARPAGMGDAFSAVADDVNALYWNPAGLGWVHAPQAQAMHALWLASLQYDTLGFAAPLGPGTLGVGLNYLWFGSPIPRIENGVLAGTFRSYDLAANLAYGVKLSSPFAVGANVKYLRSKLDVVSGSAVAADAGLLLRTNNGAWSWALVGQNLGTKMRFDQEQDRLPAQIRAGTAFFTSLGQHLADITFSADVEKPMGKLKDRDYKFNFGVEHWGGGVLALRAGYRLDQVGTGLKAISRVRAGAGFRAGPVQIDYAWMPFGALGQAHRISAAWMFAGPPPVAGPAPGAMVMPEFTAISPNGDRFRDATRFGLLVSNLDEPKRWKLVIKNAGGDTVKLFEGQLAPPTTILWTGDSQGGKTVPDGTYLYQLQVEGAGGRSARSAEGKVLVDASSPTVSLAASATWFTPDGDGLQDTVTFYAEAGDPSGVERWQIRVMNSKQKLVKTFEDRGALAPGTTHLWDGRDDYFEQVVPEGLYTVQLTADDPLGNRAVSAILPLRVVVPPKVQVREVIKEVVKREEVKALVISLESKVLFGVGKANLKPQAYQAIEQKVIRVLKAYPANQVSIEGHTDSRGNRARNMKLSERRAKAVFNFLVKKGVDPKRLTVRGWGPTKPVASNATGAGREKNRRVDIIIQPVQAKPAK